MPRTATSSALSTAASRTDAGDERTDAALRLWVILTRAQAAINVLATDDIRSEGLSEGEFGVLEYLYHKGPRLLGEIQRGVLVSSGGITFLVDRLVEKGLVERRECPTDRRARYAALTKDGEKLLRRIFPRHARRIVDAVAGLTLTEQKQAAELLKRLGLHAAELAPDP
ncbi:MAG: MarR family transcriptional regulator [Gemmatimonadaceae bacterium]|nr:MarR family transcriptional regulator [Gemmatimonadaceae bacterium]